MKGEVNIIYNITNISIQLEECRKTTKSVELCFALSKTLLAVLVLQVTFRIPRAERLHRIISIIAIVI